MIVMERQQARILVIDDDYDVLKSALVLLKRYYSRVDIEQIPENVVQKITEQTYDVILLDMNFTQGASTGREGYLWLERILQADPAAVVIMSTAYGDVEKAVHAMKAGATAD